MPRDGLPAPIERAIHQAIEDCRPRPVPLEREPENGPYRGRAKVRVIPSAYRPETPSRPREWKPALSHKSNIHWMRKEASG